MLSSLGNGDVQFNNIKLMKWIEFVEWLLENSIVTLESLGKLNEELLTKSVLLGGELKSTQADIIVFSVVHATVSDLSRSDQAKLPHLLRWVDYVQPLALIAPDEANIGECVTFSGHDGRPGDVLNPKTKQLDKITPHLFTDDKGVATFKNIPFTTSAGP